MLPVILFHGTVPGFSGGWLGVDVFFVISGFLITRILARDLAARKFSLARFYERRARRILPALVFVLGIGVVAGLVLLSPNEMRSLSEGVLASALSVSNLLFWQQLDYFGPAAEQLPLLHTWSLGIEEQFYVLFPPLLWLIWRGGRARVLAVLGLVLVVSLGLAGWATGRWPSAAFFLLPFRAWELMLGGLLALAPPRRSSGVLAAAGIAAILGAMAAVPLGLLSGLWPMVLACLGTGLVLGWSGPATAAGRLLAQRGPVAIGLISYSAYLWHQPLLAFARIRFGELDVAAALGLGAAALLLAWPTWAFVEAPFRRRGTGGARRPLQAAAVTIAALSVVGAAGIATDGFAGRVSPEVRAIMASVADVNPYRDACKTDLDAANPVHPVAACLRDGTSPGVLFYGDSHADALQGALFPAAEAAGYRFYSVTRSACPPVPGLTRTGPADSPACDAFVRGVEAFAARDGFDIVVLAARWIAGAAPGPFDNGEGGVEGKPGDFLVPFGAAPRDPAEREALVIGAYVRAVEDLLARGFRVVLVYPIPEAGWNVPEELARRRAASDAPVTLSTAQVAFDRRQAPIVAAFDAIPGPDLFRVRPSDLLCDTDLPGRCLNSLGDQPLYFDHNHLNGFGARMVTPAIMAAVAAARADTGAPD